ncbi:RNA pyrophosphohydrolase [Candidatus Endobugula sertula]|uniref:RNA pyrophosphohydrolase n=1 Tax=Candidatus Endobugula sertula TaxID=62101 RepID=A0A1D2QTD8_9GAMM|nr:RNA pyrophosphohydrolase [Candidatus Endobugula sertula]
MIDADGYRANVGIIISNTVGQVLWARRAGGINAWQFPQGGMNEGETPEQALYRELYEEVGLKPEHVEIIAVTKGWLNYELPKQFVREYQSPVCIGQKQKWFLLKLLVDDSEITLDQSDPVEFDEWQWVSYWYPVNQVIAFKRNVYCRALKELSVHHSRIEAQYRQNKNSGHVHP